MSWIPKRLPVIEPVYPSLQITYRWDIPPRSLGALTWRAHLARSLGALTWRVIGVTAAVASVHLSTGNEDGTNMIEAASLEGSREVIFAQPGAYTFKLIATFGDGIKLNRQVNVQW
jgi:hypothetical protein